MAPFIVLFTLPWILLFDIIPIIFRYKGLTSWYVDKYNKNYGDNILFFIYIPLTLITLLLLLT